MHTWGAGPEAKRRLRAAPRRVHWQVLPLLAQPHDDPSLALEHTFSSSSSRGEQGEGDGGGGEGEGEGEGGEGEGGEGEGGEGGQTFVSSAWLVPELHIKHGVATLVSPSATHSPLT